MLLDLILLKKYTFLKNRVLLPKIKAENNFLSVDQSVVLAEQQSDLRCHIKCHLRNKLAFRVTAGSITSGRTSEKKLKTKTSFQKFRAQVRQSKISREKAHGKWWFIVPVCRPLKKANWLD